VLLVQVLLSAAALLLIVAGVTKLRSPHPATRAARALGLPASPTLVRVLAVVEIAAGAGALLTGTTVARAVVGLLYAAFLAFVVVAIARNAPITSCGCFGADDTPPSLVHVAINAAGAAVAFVAAADGIEAPIDTVTESAAHGIALTVGTVVLTALAAASMSGRASRALIESRSR
jgi:hypothetical protein